MPSLQEHIIGPSGAGKTTLAGQLGRRLGLPVYDLDHIAFTDTHWTIRPRAEKDRALQKILQQAGWIVEGGPPRQTAAFSAGTDVVADPMVPSAVSGPARPGPPAQPVRDAALSEDAVPESAAISTQSQGRRG